MSQSRGVVVSAIAALGGLVAAMSCCLPVGTFLAAAGAAGAARILAPFRPWLVGLSILLLAIGFVRTYRGPQCEVRRNRFSVAVLWISAALVVGMLLFPQVIAGFLADRFSAQ
jgi:hypothetical protein